MGFIITHTDEVLVSHSGLAGALLQQSPLRKRLNEICWGRRKRPEMPAPPAVLSYYCHSREDCDSSAVTPT
jgi:hypothetical protein